VTLTGTTVTLTHLLPSHAEDLWDVLKGDKSLWTYMFGGPFETSADFTNYVNAISASREPFFYAVVQNSTGKAIGHVSLMRFDAANRTIEAGSIMFSPLLQRSTAATEAIYLLSKYAFEALGIRRYEWKCNVLNEPSQRAARRFGFKYEGIFRQHMIAKGRNRDTAWFSMLDSEWDVVKLAFEEWLKEENFDAEGKQKRRLDDIRESLGA